VHDGSSSGEQRVRDERPVTSPGHGLGAHHSQRPLLRQLVKLGQAALEIIRQHVIRISSKARVAPRFIRGSFAGALAQSAEARQVNVSDARPLKGIAQLLAVELRVAARPGDGANVREGGDPVKSKQLDEFLLGASRVAD